MKIDVKLKSGQHLGIARGWIQQSCVNGDDVQWGSQEVLRPYLTVRDVESIAQLVSDPYQAEIDRLNKARNQLKQNAADRFEAYNVQRVDDQKYIATLEANVDSLRKKCSDLEAQVKSWEDKEVARAVTCCGFEDKSVKLEAEVDRLRLLNPSGISTNALAVVAENLTNELNKLREEYAELEGANILNQNAVRLQKERADRQLAAGRLSGLRVALDVIKRFERDVGQPWREQLMDEIRSAMLAEDVTMQKILNTGDENV